MREHTILRGKVSAYPAEGDKGLVEVMVGAYEAGKDTVLARVAQSLPGVYWLPEIGDVVEVELPRLPGREARIVHIHRGAQDPQVSACWTDQNDRKQFRTRSGHSLTLDDTADGGQVVLRTAGGLELRMEDKTQSVLVGMDQKETPLLTLDMENDMVTVTAGKGLTICCGKASVTVDESGNLSISTEGRLSLTGKEISLEARSKLTAKGQKLELSGTMEAALSGKNQLKMSSGGIAQIKGHVVKLN